jgi:uncharacterized membrane protein
MSSPDPAPHDGKNLGFERFLFFSDAVFAIAITLLVLNVKPALDAHLAFSLGPSLPNLVGFGLSFYVVGRYWLVHHLLFEGVRGYDRRLLVTNLCLLASIAFLPFPTSVIVLAKAESGSVILYTLSVAAVGLLMMLLAMVARRPALLRPGETRGGTVGMLTSMAVGPLVFIASAALALRDPRRALWLLLSLVPLGWVFDRLGRALQRRIDGSKPKD